MSKDEFKILVKAMKAVYADPKFISDKDAFDVWYSLLQDLEYRTASTAVQKYMLSNKFPPSISDIREQYVSITSPEVLSEMEAWSMVSKALRRSIYYADSEYDKLPEAVQKAVGSPEMLRSWAETDMKSIENVVQSNFMRTYRTVLNREKEISKMPENIKMIMQFSGKEIECN